MKFWRKLGLAVLLCFLACSQVSPPNSDSAQAPAPSPVSIPLAEPVLHFFTFGDWGTGGADQTAVAQAVRNFCNQAACDFGLLLGDNFYDNGVDSVDDPLWQSRFEQVYLGLDLPFYAVLGNHDHQGNFQAQIDYSSTPGQNRWNMPGRQYIIAFSEGASAPLMEIFALDSHTFSAADATKLQEDLNASQAGWKLVAMHHPIYSNGTTHGDTQNLIDLLLPVICHEAEIVLVGHDHLFSHLFDPSKGCINQHFVVGTGGKGLYTFDAADPRALFSLSEFGFATLHVTPQQIRIQFHKTDGGIAYEYLLQK